MSIQMLATIPPLFYHRQGAFGGTNTNVNTISAVLPNNPALGSIVCVAWIAATSGGGSPGTLTIKDGNSNSYTLTPSSVLTATGTQAGNYYALAYILSAPSNANATIQASWSSTAGQASLWVDEFGLASGSAFFDKDSALANGTATGTSMNTSPSITPAASGELFYALAGATNGTSAPTTGQTLGVWTCAGGGYDGNFGTAAEYSPLISTPTAIDYTSVNSGDQYAGIMMAIRHL